MTLKTFKSTSGGIRRRTSLDLSHLTQKRPEKSLTVSFKDQAGRNSWGKVTVRHQGGGEKRLCRVIDFVQDKKDISARVVALEYDPGRTANIALLVYDDGEKRYILAPEGLKVGDKIMTGQKAELQIGNRLPLSMIPAGTPIHNIELEPGKGGRMVKSAGSAALIQSKEENMVIVKLPSTELRKIPLSCYASLGQVSNPEWRNVILGKAGKKRHMGIRPSVRGVAMNPSAHPHGGGEGRSGIGMPSPKSRWGKKVGGIKTRKKHRASDKLIVKRRK